MEEPEERQLEQDEEKMTERKRRARASWVAVSSTAQPPHHLPPFQGSGGSDYEGDR